MDFPENAITHQIKYAREKALDAVFAFVEEANIAGT
jgi:hypothetical protein